jgi:hypothetical protein
MPSTIPLSKTIEYARRFIYNSPLLFTNEGTLAFSIADDVRQFILSPPFCWRWNRGTVAPITCQAGQTDYQVNLPDFGWIERAWITFPSTGIDPNQPLPTKELTVNSTLAQETVQGQPAFISALLDDNNGNITFRLMGTPDDEYILNIIYQKVPPNFSSVTDTWYPIPDYLSYLVQAGFLSKAYEYKGDERLGFSWQQFLKQVVAASDGLTEAEKNIFLEPRIAAAREQGALQTSQQARSARGGA